MHQLMYTLKSQQISVWQDQGKLKLASQSDVSQSDIVATIRAHKTQLLDYLQRHNINSRLCFEQTQIFAAESNAAPLTLGQTQMMFSQQVSEQTHTYHIPCLLKLSKDCDRDAMEQALQRLCQRHSALSVCFVSSAQGQIQQQCCDTPFVLTQLDCDEATLDETCQQLFTRPFALSEERPFRGTWLSTESHNYLYLLWHHIAFDGWSLGVFLTELQASYQGTALAPALQFNDYAHWQAQRLSAQRIATLKDYWLTQLDAHSALHLPCAYTRPKVFDHTGANATLTLPDGSSEQLQALAKRHKISTNTLGLAAWFHTLSLYSGQQDLTIGLPSDNRPNQACQQILGYFVNSLPIRLQTELSHTLGDWLALVQRQVNEAKAHQDLPFEEIKSALDVTMDTSRHPVFQTMFTSSQFQHATEHALWQQHMTDTNANVTAKFDLTMHLELAPDQAQVNLNYASALYSKEHAQRIAALYTQILTAYAQSMETERDTLFSLPLLSQSDLDVQHLLSGHSDAFPPLLTITERFAHIAAKYPQHIALQSAERHWTYQQLDQETNRLAAQIQAFAPGVQVVALHLPGNAPLVIAMLATLKAGAAYTTLPYKDPLPRRAYQLEDSQAELLLTQNSLIEEAGILADSAQLPLLNVDDILGNTSLSTEPVQCETTPHSPANIIYTSGTTGKPKGALLTHYGCTSFTADCQYIKITSQSRMMQLANPAFDATTIETWMCLLNGATLYCGYSDLLSQITEFKKMLCEEQISTLFLTRALFDTLFQQDPTLFASLEHLLSGGEALTPELVNQLVNSQYAPKHFYNLYGPTECSSCTTSHEITGQDTRIPIGKPIQGRAVAVIGQYGQLLPLGCPGELYIGGAGLALGYLNRDTLSAEKFVTLKVFGQPQSYYRSGDLVYWQPDGTLAYLGRNDEQVKIRGHRVELGEIEQHLNALPEVSNCALVVRKHQGHSQLDGYVVLAEAGDINTQLDTLRDTLNQRLPDYMQPHTLSAIEQLPLTTSGKLDKRRLPEPQRVSDTVVEPESATERKLLALWQSLLGIDSMCVTQPVMHYGADSIRLLHFCSAASKEGWQLTPKLLIEHNTIRTQAALLEQQNRDLFNCMTDDEALQAVLTLPHFEPGLIRPAEIADAAIVHLFPAAASADSFNPLVEKLSTQFEVHALENVKIFTGRHLNQLSLVRYYAERIVAHQSEGPYYLGGFCEGAALSLEVARHLESMGHEVAHSFLIDPILPQLSATQLADAEQRVQDSDPSLETWPIGRAFVDFVRHFRTAHPYAYPVSFFTADRVNDEAMPTEALGLFEPVFDVATVYKATFALPDNGFATLLPQAEYIDLHSAHDEIMTDEEDLNCIATRFNQVLSSAQSHLVQERRA
ncbi:amino acid adenylation domain-containing protein [Pseudoalteromonas rubra]|uniref:Amino acid adenylation domain-containing protein n=1 Tax=Pseudoalteromonas rubra TaxID=43658 RepID=A0A7S7YZE6_9GAMM|nr:non-ribosomal peptide synthetase [Pseudoalteromonas rubra]QPB84862.1 amino acid adenylation domain-containing protein [Pseudoalteromonas rubra]